MYMSLFDHLILMSKKLGKSIYGRIKELPAPRPMPVFVHGDKLS